MSGKSTLTSVYIKILEERYKQSGLRESVYIFLHRKGTTEENARKFSSMHWLGLRSSPNELPLEGSAYMILSAEKEKKD